MKTTMKIAAMGLMLGMAAPAFAAMNNTLAVDPDASVTNPVVNHKDAVKGDTSPHVNAPKSIERKAPDAPHMPMGKPMPPHAGHPHGGPMAHDGNLTPAERDAIAQKRMMHKDKMKAMTPAQREEARKRWEARRAEWQKMTPAERAAAKAKWDAEHAPR